MSERPIRIGDIARTIEPIDGWIRGGIVQSIDGTLAVLRSGTDDLTVDVADLVHALSLPERLIRFHDAMHAAIVTRQCKPEGIPGPLWNEMHALFVTIRHPLGVPRARPLLVEDEGIDPADGWKGGQDSS